MIFGSRGWRDQDTVTADVGELFHAHGDALVIIQGDCTGADTCGKKAARVYGIPCINVPAQWGVHDQHGHTPVPCTCPSDAPTCRAAGIRRNQFMIDEHKPDYGLGYRSAGRSPGTDDMARRLKAAGIHGKIKRLRPKKTNVMPPSRTGISKPAIESEQNTLARWAQHGPD